MFEETYARDWDYLIDLDLHLIAALAQGMGIDPQKIVRSSTLGVRGDKIDKLIAICQKFNADILYEGAAGKNYIDPTVFSQKGIHVEFQDYLHPVYRQLYGEFIPYLSAIDLLFNQGERSLAVLTHQA